MGCKWIHKIKYNVYVTISHYKAHLISKGFHQTPGINYIETFSPIVKSQTIRTILSIVVTNGREVLHININNAFLNDTLDEVVYIS